MRWLIFLAATGMVVGACESNEPRPDRPSAPGDTFVPPETTTTRLTPRTRELTKYGTSSAIIQYRNHWLGRDQTFYFDRYGAREAIYTAAGGKDAREVPYDVSIYSGGLRVHYNTVNRTGVKRVTPNTPAPLLGAVPDLHTVKLASTGVHTIAGVKAQGVTFQLGSRMHLWMWKGVPLRVEEIRPGGDTLLLEAISIAEGTVIPAGRFSVPRDVTFR